MKIISHRGYWKAVIEKNTAIAFDRSFNCGYGTETDVRDILGSIVISHDAPNGGEMSLADFFKIYGKTNLLMALNIKADGLSSEIIRLVKEYKIENWFAFDMSVPDMREYLKAGLPVFCRMSEVERAPIWLEECSGIWLDSFNIEWYSAKIIDDILRTQKKLCIVSSELHGRNNEKLWNLIKPFANEGNLILCTDLPEAANNFFFGMQNEMVIS